MLANIEHELRILIWVQANSTSKRKTPFPKRLESPAKSVQMTRRLESTDIDKLNEVLGIGGD